MHLIKILEVNTHAKYLAGTSVFNLVTTESVDNKAATDAYGRRAVMLSTERNDSSNREVHYRK